MIHIINKTKHGLVFKCRKCNKIHVEFSNINMNLTEKEFLKFSEYIAAINGEYWEEQNKECVFTRKIRIPINSNRICLVLNLEELQALQELFETPIASLQFDENLLEKLTSNFSLN